MDAKLGKARADQTFWEQLALEADHAKAALAAQLATLQAQSATQAKERVAGFVTAANAAAAKLLLDETETRKLIDEQLCQAGWTVDSTSLRHARGARPEKGKNLAIAEYVWVFLTRQTCSDAPHGPWPAS
jgi:type I restriction enzyme R subunit